MDLFGNLGAIFGCCSPELKEDDKKHELDYRWIEKDAPHV